MDEIIYVRDLVHYLEVKVPNELAEDYDNVGLLIGNMETPIQGIIVGLEVTDILIDQAIDKKCNMVIVHHPLIFRGIKSIREDKIPGHLLLRMIKADMNLYVLHTNLDAVPGGLTDYVAKRLDMHITVQSQLPRIYTCKPKTMEDFIRLIKEQLGIEYLHVAAYDNKIISRVGMCTGSGMSLYEEAVKHGIDVYLTGDMKYHDAMMAKEIGVPVIDATHFYTEVGVIDLLKSIVSEGFGSRLEIYRDVYPVNPIHLI